MNNRDELENNIEYSKNININNNKNNCNEYIIKLYNSVFNNNYIKRIILNHLNIYNILSTNTYFKTIQQWQQFKHKQYLCRIIFNFEFNLNQLPENIKNIQISIPSSNREKNEFTIPSHIKSVALSTEINQFNSTPMAIKEKLIKLHLTNKNYRELKYKLPQSLTELRIESYNGTIPKNVLPNNLKKLRITKIESFEDGCFPQSLENVDISGPLSLLKQFSNGTFNNLVNLQYTCLNDDPINNDIQFPNTLQELYISCNSFNTRLPDNLKSLALSLIKIGYDIKYPSSLEDLYVTVNNFDRQIFENQKSAPINLKSLELTCSSLIYSNGNSILPNKLEKLIIIYDHFNQELESNHLPSSLTYLDTGGIFNQKIHQLPSSLTYLKLGRSFNQVIDVNVLPSTLKSLIIDNSWYSQLINPLAIPKQLRLLDVYCFKLDLSPLKTLSTTHLNTVIVIKESKRFLSEFYDASNTQIRVLRLPHFFNEPLSTLQLQDKSNLEYLHLGEEFCYPIQLSDLPTPNNIKTLVLSRNYGYTINLEHFQNVETIVVQLYTSPFPIITSTKDQNGCYNTYNLKTIYANPSDRDFLGSLDLIFFQFLKRGTPDSVNY